ncbi:MAG: hypothetical protein ACJ75P_03105 [Gaiellaceae bacterium]
MGTADEALARAEEIERSYGPPVLALRLDSALDPEPAAARTRAAIAALGSGGEVHWSVDVEPAGVIVRQWGFAPNIGATLAALAAELEGSGVYGRLVAHLPEPDAARTPLRERDEELLECHVRVRGERRLHTSEHELRVAARLGREPPDPVVRFFPDDAALHAGIEAALEWVGSPPAGAELWSFGDAPHRDVREVRAHVAGALAGAFDRGRVMATAWWESDDSFRMIGVWPGRGDISFVEGGARLASGDWRPAYAALLEALRAASGWASYGLVKRGRRPGHAGRSLTYDWVPALHYGSYNLEHHAYEDVLAPDAFGAQLLGPGYAGRIPSSGDWERDDVESDVALLLHRDPAAWFGVPLPPITPDDCIRRDPSYPTPRVLIGAREDLADILVTVDVVSRAPLDPLRV